MVPSLMNQPQMLSFSWAPSPAQDSVPSPIPRNTESSLIILLNGKPLNSSLKSSTSAPCIHQNAHLRAQSAPTTPNVLTIVYFAGSDGGLESVRIYNQSGKPANISRPAGEETETETEAEPSDFPFPHSPGPSPLATQSSLPTVNPDHSTPLPIPLTPMPISTSRPCLSPSLGLLLSTVLSLSETLLSRNRLLSGLLLTTGK